MSERYCPVCGESMVWNVYLRRWEDAERPCKHMCELPSRMLTGSIMECLCGNVVVVYSDGKRLNERGRTPHRCNGQQ